MRRSFKRVAITTRSILCFDDASTTRKEKQKEYGSYKISETVNNTEQNNIGKVLF